MMARVLVMLMAAWSLGADKPIDKPMTAVESLQGEWVVEKAECKLLKDLPNSLKDFNGHRTAFDGDRSDGPLGAAKGAAKGKYTFKLDPWKSPAEIDFLDDGQTVSRGIYRLDGDTLTLCIGLTTESRGLSALPGAKPLVWQVADKRPTKFESDEGVLVLLKRAK